MRWLLLVIAGLGFGNDMAGQSGAQAPSPVKIESYSRVEIPGERSVSHMIAFGDKLLIGTDEGVWVKDGDSAWKKTLPFYVWDDFFIVGETFVYVTINRFSRKNKLHKALLQLYRSKNGIEWELVLKKAPELIAVDAHTDSLYLGAKHSSYSTALSKGKPFGSFKPLEDNRKLYDLLDMAYHKGRLFVVGKQGVVVSEDGGKTFRNINVLFNSAIGREPKVRFLSNDHDIAVEINGHRVFVSHDAGESFTEVTKDIAELRVKRGHFAVNRVFYLDRDSRLVLSHRSRYYLLDLKDESIREIVLPTFYRYRSFAILGDHLYVSALHPKPRDITTPGSEGRDLSKEAAFSPLLNVSLSSRSLCDKIYALERIEASPFPEALSEIIADGDTLYGNSGRAIRHVGTDSVVANGLSQAHGFTQGNRGHWYIQHVVTDSRGKATNRLSRSMDTGRTWKPMLTGHTIPPHSVYDDSLGVAYYAYKHSVIRRSLRSGEMDQQSLGGFDNRILKLQVDSTSRLWVFSKKGLFISQLRGFWESPLPPFEHALPLSGFALHRGKMIIGNDKELFISRTDTLSWKKLPFVTGCSRSMSVRLLKSSKEWLLLQDMDHGDLYLWNVERNQTKRLAYSVAEYGIIEHIQFTSSHLLLRTSGIPFYAQPHTRKEKPAQGLVYFIHIKH